MSRFGCIIARLVSPILCCAFAMAMGVTARSQPPANPRQEIPSRLPSVLKQGVVEPDAFYLRDANGNFIFVPNVRYEQFEQMVKDQKQATATALPSYAIQQVTAKGTIDARDVAFWDVDVQVRLSESHSGVTGIPINLSELHLLADPQFEGGGEQMLELGNQPTGFRWWIRGEAGSEFRLRMQLIARVVATGDRRAVRLNLPSGPCRVETVIPQKDVEASVQGQGSEVLTTESLSDGSTRLSATGSGGAMTLVWQSASKQPRVASLEAQSVTRFEIVPNNGVRCQTKVTTRSLGQPLPATITVQLPADAKWIAPEVKAERYGLSLVESSVNSNAADPANDPTAAKGNSPKVLVQIQQSANELPLEFQIDWEQELPENPRDQALMLSVPLLENVDRHEGVLEVLFPSSIRLGTSLVSGTTFTSQSSSGADKEFNTSRYRFDQQPAGVNASLRSEWDELRWRPVYVVEVSPERLNLSGLLDISVVSSRMPSIDFSVNQWQILEVRQPEGETIVPFRPLGPEVTEIDVPMVLNQGESVGTDRKITLEIAATRQLNSSTGTGLRVEVPGILRNQSDSQDKRIDFGSGVLVLVPSKNIQLRPEEEQLAGLIPDTQIPASVLESIPLEQRSRALVYRFQSSGLVPQWNGAMESLPQQISAEGQVRIEFLGRQVSLRQHYDLRIDNEPLAKLKLIAPKSWLSNPDLLCTLNGSAVTLTELAASELLETRKQYGLEAMSADYTIAMLTSTSQLTGKVEFDLEVVLAGIDADGVANSKMVMPLGRLLLPKQSQMLRELVNVVGSNDLSIAAIYSVNAGATEKVDWSASKRNEPFRLNPRVDSLQFEIEKLDRAESARIEISRAWLQTAFNAAQRRDRFAIKFQTSDRRLALNLPAQNAGRIYEVLIDGKRADVVNQQGSERLLVDLGQASPNEPHILELWSDAGRGAIGRPISIDLPVIEGSDGLQRFYWELVLPGNEHLLLPPEQMTPEWQWKWSGPFWARQSELSQAALEQWVGASRQLPLPSQVNRYVLSTFGPQTEIVFFTAPKTWIWFPAGAAIILLSILWSSFRWTRHPVSLTVLFSSLVLVGLYAPDVAMLGTQLGAAGLIIAIVFGLTKWSVDRRVRRRSVFTSFPTSGVSTPSGSAMSERSGPQVVASGSGANVLQSTELRP